MADTFEFWYRRAESGVQSFSPLVLAPLHVMNELLGSVICCSIPWCGLLSQFEMGLIHKPSSSLVRILYIWIGEYDRGCPWTWSGAVHGEGPSPQNPRSISASFSINSPSPDVQSLCRQRETIDKTLFSHDGPVCPSIPISQVWNILDYNYTLLSLVRAILLAYHLVHPTQLLGRERESHERSTASVAVLLLPRIYFVLPCSIFYYA